MIESLSTSVVLAAIGFFAVNKLGRIEKVLDNIKKQMADLTESIDNNGNART
jgi:hypothetical protein